MGKGGYGKGWSNTSRKGSWQLRYQQWHHGKGQWGGSNYNWQQSQVVPSQTAVPNDNTLAQLCGGRLSSAWDGVCSGVASAAWHAVQGTAGAMLKARGVTTASKHDDSKTSFDTSAKSLMSCLAGKPAETPTVASQEKPTHHQEGPPSGNDVSNQVLLSVLEMQKQQLQQQSMLQQQVLQLQSSQTPVPNPAVTQAEVRQEPAECEEPAEDQEGAESPKPKPKRTPGRKPALKAQAPAAKHKAKAAKAKAKSSTKVRAAASKPKRSSE